ncbi:MAG: hypothetical protein HY718_12400 [Planctomycetes bacterium]|nr:hypothetical protein [Planctomycetota bacterium]
MYDHVRDVTTDTQGNVYLTGGTESADFAVTPGAYQTVHNRGLAPDNASIQAFDVFVVKLDPNGNRLWSTFLGGRNYDRAYAIEVAGDGYIYVAGRAGNGFPVTAGAFQTTFMGGQEADFYGPQDGFIAKLSPDGSTLVWASYFGTSDTRIIRDIAIDAAGDVYLASGYSSGSYPAGVAAAFNNTPKGGMDAVAAKVKSDGSQVLWATYLGGSANEIPENSVRIDNSGRLYLLTSSQSAGAATPGAYDTSLAGPADFFLVRLQPADGTLLWATYVGGSQGEGLETHELAIDNQGNPIIGAVTTSTLNYPTTPGAFDTTHNGLGGAGTGQGTNYPGDVAVSKISADGTQLLASTLVGGRWGESGEGFAGVDAAGRVYLTGGTFSDNFPATSDAYQALPPANLNAFVIVLSPDLDYLLYSTYLGGSNWDVCRAATVAPDGTVYVAGETVSTNWPTLNPLQPSYGGGNADGMIAKLKFTPVAPIIAEVSPDPKRIPAGREYLEALGLAQGTPPFAWSIVQSPAAAQVDTRGRVSGWTPSTGNMGMTFSFSVRAGNLEGSDTEAWQVTVESIADLDDDDDVDVSDFGVMQQCFSGGAAPAGPGCAGPDLDSDGDVDAADFNLFLPCMNGAERRPGC